MTKTKTSRALLIGVLGAFGGGRRKKPTFLHAVSRSHLSEYEDVNYVPHIRPIVLAVAALATLANCDGVVEHFNPPKPDLSIEPHDLTSLIGPVPIRVVVSSSSQSLFPQRSSLDAIAGSLDLVDLSSGASVTFTTEVQETTGDGYGVTGYPKTVSDYVEVKPSSPLAPESWYELRLTPVPPDVRLASSVVRKLPGGGVSSRFAIGSHPTLRSLEGGRKSDGTFSAQLDVSEAVNLTQDIGTQLRLEPEQATDGCALGMPLFTVAAVSAFTFRCSLAASSTRRFRLSVAQTITSPTGAGFEASLGVQGDYSLLIEESMWQECGYQCGRVALQ